MTYIYLVENINNNPFNVYIGKTKGSRKNKHKQKYGPQISYTVIDEIDSLDYKKWGPLEDYWIKQFIVWGFNVVNKRKKGGNGPEFQTLESNLKRSKAMKGRKRNPESTEKQRQKVLGQKRPNMSIKLKGQKKGPMSKETKLKIKISNLGKSKPGSGPKKGDKIFSKETCIKISKNKIGKGVKSIYCIEDNKNFKSIEEASIFYNIKRRSIQNILSGRAKKTKNLLTFKYI